MCRLEHCKNKMCQTAQNNKAPYHGLFLNVHKSGDFLHDTIKVSLRNSATPAPLTNLCRVAVLICWERLL